MRRFKKVNALAIIAVMLFVSIGAYVNVYAASIGLNKKSLTLTVGKTATLKVKGTKKKVVWSSSNRKIATVTKKGKVKARKKGTATIYAKVGKKKLKCKVKVKAAPVKDTPLAEYWAADSAVAESLRDYVAKVTDPKNGDSFIPEKDRIAVFDMDGTLTCETFYTYYDTMMFIEYCLRDHPDRVADDNERVWGTQDWDKKSADCEAMNYVPVSMKKDFAKIYADQISKAAEQYQEKEWTSAQPSDNAKPNMRDAA